MQHSVQELPDAFGDLNPNPKFNEPYRSNRWGHPYHGRGLGYINADPSKVILWLSGWFVGFMCAMFFR